jgi:hypothetical protein
MKALLSAVLLICLPTVGWGVMSFPVLEGNYRLNSQVVPKEKKRIEYVYSVGTGAGAERILQLRADNFKCNSVGANMTQCARQDNIVALPENVVDRVMRAFRHLEVTFGQVTGPIRKINQESSFEVMDVPQDVSISGTRYLGYEYYRSRELERIDFKDSLNQLIESFILGEDGTIHRPVEESVNSSRNIIDTYVMYLSLAPGV